MLLISNGRVIDPATGTDAPRDILLDGDRIAAVALRGQVAARAKDRVRIVKMASEKRP